MNAATTCPLCDRELFLGDDPHDETTGKRILRCTCGWDEITDDAGLTYVCLLYTSPSPRDRS